MVSRRLADKWSDGRRRKGDASLPGWYPEGSHTARHNLDDRLKELMHELGNAINESLSDSDRISEAISEIKRAGYDVFLVLEATIGFNRREEDGADGDDEMPTHASLEISTRDDEATARIRWSSQDEKFLRALKIAVDDDQG